LGELLGEAAAPATAAEAFDLVAAAVDGFAGLSYATLGLAGRRIGADAGVPA
jgi:hypothetical protein